MLWSVQRNELLWRVKCGGAHRVWDLALQQSVLLLLWSLCCCVILPNVGVFKETDHETVVLPCDACIFKQLMQWQ